MFNFLKSCQAVFQSDPAILPSHQRRRRVRSCCSFNYNHSGGWVAGPPGDFNRHSLMANDAENFFLCLFGHLHLFLCEVSVKVIFIEFLVFLLSSTDSLCGLDASPLSEMCVAKSFASCGLPVYFLTDTVWWAGVFIFAETQFVVFLPLPRFGHSCFLNPFKETVAFPKGYQGNLPFSSCSFWFSSYIYDYIHS